MWLKLAQVKDLSKLNKRKVLLSRTVLFQGGKYVSVESRIKKVRGPRFAGMCSFALK